MEDSQIVQDYLFTRYRISLEDLLAYGSAGVVSLALEQAGVRVRAGCLQRERHDDGGLSELHEGTLSLCGATYGFRVSICRRRGQASSSCRAPWGSRSRPA